MNLKQSYPVLLFIAFSFTMLSIPAFSKPYLTTTRYVELLNVNDTVPANDTSADGKIFESVEEEAYFAGGEASWRSYLEQNLNPSVPVDRGAKAGIYTVYIQFVVDIDGKISNIKTPYKTWLWYGGRSHADLKKIAAMGARCTAW